MSIEQTPRNALRVRNFQLFLAMRIASSLATQMQSVAIAWQVYDITHSPLSLGLVGLAQFVPIFGFTLIAGHVADKFDRRYILFGAMSLQCLCSLLLLAFILSGARQVWPIYALLVLLGTSRAFFSPASQSLLPNLVPAEFLSSAFALSSSAFQAMTIAGPALGGMIYALGPSAVYSTSAVLFVLSLTAIGGIRTPLKARDSRGISWESVIAGIRFIWARPSILGSISLDLFAVLFGGATALLPVYARDILGTGPLGLGLLRSAPAVGAVAVGLFLAQHSLGRRTGRTMFAAVAVFGVATVIFGLSTQFYVSMAALAILGAADMVSVFVRQNLIQRATPDTMRGRVNAVNFLFVGASNELGEMESGLTAAWIGSVEAVVAGGVATLLVVVWGLWRFPALRETDRLEDIKPS
jgi:MFS family permease